MFVMVMIVTIEGTSVHATPKKHTDRAHSVVAGNTTPLRSLTAPALGVRSSPNTVSSAGQSGARLPDTAAVVANTPAGLVANDNRGNHLRHEKKDNLNYYNELDEGNSQPVSPDKTVKKYNYTQTTAATISSVQEIQRKYQNALGDSEVDSLAHQQVQQKADVNVNLFLSQSKSSLGSNAKRDNQIERLKDERDIKENESGVDSSYYDYDRANDFEDSQESALGKSRSELDSSRRAHDHKDISRASSNLYNNSFASSENISNVDKIDNDSHYCDVKENVDVVPAVESTRMFFEDLHASHKSFNNYMLDHDHEVSMGAIDEEDGVLQAADSDDCAGDSFMVDDEDVDTDIAEEIENYPPQSLPRTESNMSKNQSELEIPEEDIVVQHQSSAGASPTVIPPIQLFLSTHLKFWLDLEDSCLVSETSADHSTETLFHVSRPQFEEELKAILQCDQANIDDDFDMMSLFYTALRVTSTAASCSVRFLQSNLSNATADASSNKKTRDNLMVTQHALCIYASLCANMNDIIELCDRILKKHVILNDHASHQQQLDKFSSNAQSANKPSRANETQSTSLDDIWIAILTEASTMLGNCFIILPLIFVLIAYYFFVFFCDRVLGGGTLGVYFSFYSMC